LTQGFKANPGLKSANAFSVSFPAEISQRFQRYVFEMNLPETNLLSE